MIVKDLIGQCFHDGFTAKELIVLLQNHQDINPFSNNVPLLYPRKTSENRRFSDVFTGYRSGTLVENGLWSVLRHYIVNWGSIISVGRKNELFHRELDGSIFCTDYNEIHQCGIRNRLRVSWAVAAQIMKHPDHISINAGRKRVSRHPLYYSKNPNWVWHMDGYN